MTLATRHFLPWQFIFAACETQLLAEPRSTDMSDPNVGAPLANIRLSGA